MADENRIVREDDRLLQERLRQIPAETIVEEEELEPYAPVLSRAERQRLQLRRAKTVIYFIVNTAAILILLRVLLKALAAQETNSFAWFLYAITGPLVAPFLTLFGEPPVFGDPTRPNVFEFSSLFAIGIYYFLAWFVGRILSFALTRPATSEG